MFQLKLERELNLSFSTLDWQVKGRFCSVLVQQIKEQQSVLLWQVQRKLLSLMENAVITENVTFDVETVG